MNNLVKGLIITAVCLILIGFAMGLVGFTRYSYDPGYQQALEEYRSGSGRYSSDSNGYLSDDRSYLRNGYTFSRTISGDFSAMDISIDIAEIKVYKSEDSDVHLEATGLFEEEIFSEVADGVFTFQERLNSYGSGFNILSFGPFKIGANGRPYLNFGNTFNYGKMEIKLYLPEKQYDKIKLHNGVGRMDGNYDFHASNIDMNFDVGDVNLGNIQADTLKIQCGVGRLRVASASSADLTLVSDIGDCNFDSLTASKSADVSSGVGRMTLDNCSLYDANIEMNVGDFNLSGQLLGKSRIDQGVGSATIQINDSKNNYYLHFNKSIGSFTARENGRTIGWTVLDDEYEIGSKDAPNQMMVNGGVGELRVEFN